MVTLPFFPSSSLLFSNSIGNFEELEEYKKKNAALLEELAKAKQRNARLEEEVMSLTVIAADLEARQAKVAELAKINPIEEDMKSHSSS